MSTHDTDDHPHGLAHDLRILNKRLSRRGLLAGLLGGVASVPLIPLVGACTDAGTTGAGPDASTSGTDGTGGATCATIPTETAGPYPGDGTNGPNALTASGIVRSDMRASFGTSTTVAAGVELTITLTIVDAGTCEPLAGRAVYLWHCDQVGRYSMYSPGVTNENYLRGVQVTDASGKVTFTSIYPGCYAGRWPHIHFEVYASATAATSGSNKIAVSQLAMPKTTNDQVYATTGYEASVANQSQITLARDNVFSDGATLEIPTMTGSVDASLTATLTVAV